MDGWWPWALMAATGALHGLNPLSGWCLLAARGTGARGAAATARGVLALAAGHIAALAIAGFAFAQGLWPDAGSSRQGAAALLIAFALYRACQDLLPPRAGRCDAPAASPRAAPARRGGEAGLALWSCLMATGQGVGLVLLPALAPMCAASAADAPVALALAMIAVHLAAMLLAAAAVAAGVDRGLASLSSRAGAHAVRHGWTAALAIAGVAVALRG